MRYARFSLYSPSSSSPPTTILTGLMAMSRGRGSSSTDGSPFVSLPPRRPSLGLDRRAGTAGTAAVGAEDCTHSLIRTRTEDADDGSATHLIWMELCEHAPRDVPNIRRRIRDTRRSRSLLAPLRSSRLEVHETPHGILDEVLVSLGSNERCGSSLGFQSLPIHCIST